MFLAADQCLYQLRHVCDMHFGGGDDRLRIRYELQVGLHLKLVTPDLAPLTQS